MLNKKAIAAFAAGATLLSGMAFAAPAFAETAPQQETCKVDQSKVDAAQAAVDTATAAEHTAAAAARKAQAKVEAANAQYAAVKKLNKAYEDAKAKNTAATTTDADKYSKEQKDGFKKAEEDAKAALEKGLKDAYKAIEGKDATDQAKYDTVADVQAARNTASNELEAANDTLAEKKAELTSAQADLDKAQCKDAKPQGPKNPPVTPAQPDSKTAAIKNVLSKKVDVDAASHDFAEKKEAYTKAAAALTAAKAELDAANKAAAVAAQNLSDFEASGVNDSAKLKSLQEAVARADAHVVRTTAAFNKALADFNDAKTADLTAQDAYKAAKDAYDEAYNAAIKLGVNPALLPSVTAVDPLSPAFPQLAQAQKIYADALAGKFGAAAQKAVQKAEAAAKAPAAAADKKADKQGKITVEKGKDKAGKNLPKTGAAIALTALAASVLAGMGAAVRKVRH